MTSNAPTTPQQGGIHRQLLGLPVWAWGIGVLAFVGAVFFYFRQSGSNSQAMQQQGASQSGTGFGVPVPFPVPSNANTSSVPTQSQQFGTVIADKGGGYIVPRPDPTSAGQVLGFFNPDQPLTVAGPIVKGGSYTEASFNNGAGITSDEWVPVNYGGQIGYLFAPDVTIQPPTSNAFGASVNNGMVPAPVSGGA